MSTNLTSDKKEEDLDDPEPCIESGDCVVIEKTDQVYIIIDNYL